MHFGVIIMESYGDCVNSGGSLTNRDEALTAGCLSTWPMALTAVLMFAIFDDWSWNVCLWSS